jgi:tRNA G18 (ribose-2'-O)-methylase SpoU
MVTYPRNRPAMPVHVVDPADTRLDLYRQISDAALLRDHGLFVAEGRLVVERVLDDDRFEVVSVLVSPAAQSALDRSLVRANRATIPVFVTPPQSFQSITGFDIHRGCLALVRRPPELPWPMVVRHARRVVVLEDVTNADNVGGVFRNAAAFGAGAVLLSPSTCDPLYRKAVRTSMAAVLSVPFARLQPWPDELARLRAAGFTIAALSPREPSMTIDAFATIHASHPVALVVGTEGAGLSAAALATADVRVRIPMTTAVDSLNLAVATGIALQRLMTAAG